MGDISKNEFNKLVQDISEIKDALLGTEYNNKGIIKRVESLEKDMLNINVIKWKITGYAAGIATVVSIISTIISKILL